MVGRSRELALVLQRFAFAAAGRIQVVVIVGEPGIGKTRLLDEVSVRAVEEGATFLKGAASDSVGMPPYLPFLEALGGYIRSAQLDQLRPQVDTVAAALASILPELRVRLGEVPAAYPLLPEQARLRLYEAVGTFLAAIADACPVVLSLDDLQWADTASLDLLSHIARHQPTARLLIVGACRQDEAGTNSALARAIDQLNRHRLVTTVTLFPLSAEEVSALASGYLRAPLDSAAARLLHTHSEGNPFFAEELLRGWIETGGIARHGQQWTLTPAFDSEHIPPAIVGAIHQRLARLSSDVVGLLQTAAIIGRAFNVPLLISVASTDADSVETCLHTAVRAGLIRVDRTGTYAFSHDKIRECLYGEVPPARRQRLHTAIGSVLESQRKDESATRLAALAFHFSRSGDRARGASYALSAAESAVVASAGDEALAQYQTALGLLAPDDTRRVGALLGMGKAAIVADRPADAAKAYETAYALSSQAADKASAALGLHTARQRLDDRDGAYASLVTAVTLFKDRPARETIEALTWLGELEALRGNFTEATALAKRGLKLAKVLRDDGLEAQAYAILGKALSRMNKLPAGLELLERALELATNANDPYATAVASATLAFETHRAAHIRRCREASLVRIESAPRLHDPEHVRRAEAWFARLAARQGKWTESEHFIARVGSHSTVEQMSRGETADFLYQARGFIAYNRGDYATAEREFQALAVSLAKFRAERTRYQGLLGLVQLLAGKRREAQAYIADQEVLLAQLQEGSTPTAPILVCLTVMALIMGEHEPAERYYRRLLAFQGQFHWFLVDRILALVEILHGDWAAAETHFAAAESVARREEILLEVPLALVGRAELELARGGRGNVIRARTLLGEALPLFEDLGMAAEVSRARERLRRLPHQPGAPNHPPYPAGLSAREVEVLRLVAGGLTNRQIAERLALSERTVVNHISSIFNKTDAGNRTAAAAFATRHGLA